MRLLLLLATTVLLAGCVNETDDLFFLPLELGSSLVYYLDPSAGGKHDDPWDSIRKYFDVDAFHGGKNGEQPDDPWDSIQDSFSVDTVHKTGRRGLFQEYSKSEVLFVSFLRPTPGLEQLELELVEVRDGVGRFCALSDSDRELYALNIPGDWKTGLVLSAGCYWLKDEEALPLLGASNWEVLSERTGLALPVSPLIRVVPDTVGGRLVWPDPWDQIRGEGI